jgi:hypothetical protein
MWHDSYCNMRSAELREGNGRGPSIRFGDWWHHQNFYSRQLTLSAIQTTLTEIGYARQKPQDNQFNLALCYV